jgi:hypothetical protein
VKQLERRITITYRWWRSSQGEIKKHHIEALEESAMDRIMEMIKQGYTSGELKDNIHILARDPMDGVEYSGYWEMKEGADTTKKGCT